MKRMTILATAVLCTLFMAVTLSRPTLAFAQEEKPEPKQEPEAKPEHPQPQENPKAEKKQEKPEKSEKAEKNDKENARQDKFNSQPAQAEPGSREPAGQPAAQGQPAGRGRHIPDDKFRASFGHGHTFKVSRPVVVNNQTTIQYSGYSFILADPWPTGWAYTDDCYIDYVDGEYFLFDLLHPGVRIALVVMM